MDYLIPLSISGVLLLIGFAAGTIAEKRHFARLEKREASTGNLVRTQSKMFLAPTAGSKPPMILCSEAVIASDYFKNFLAGIRKFFGGEMGSYHSLMERARRETLAKLLEQAQAHGYNAVCNVRLEPADVGGNSRKKASAMVCIIGTATAYDSDLAQSLETTANQQSPQPEAPTIPPAMDRDTIPPKA